MPIDTRFPTWMLPQSSPMDALFKGVAAGSQIAANRYRNKALYAQAQEFQQQQDLQERELMAQNESRTLANEVHRTKLDNDAADFSIMREWWPKFSAAKGEELMDMELPNLHDPDRLKTVSAAVTAKWAKEKELEMAEGNSALANLMSGGTDISSPEGRAKAYGIFARYRFLYPRMDEFERAAENQQKINQKKFDADVATGMLDQLDANGNVVAKQFVDENTGEPIRGWHAVPKKGGGWERMKTPDAIEPKDLTPAQNISRLNTLARIEQSNLKALDGLTGKEAKAQAVSIRKRLDAVTEELNAIGARTPATGPSARATDTGVQHGPPGRVRVRNKATGATGWWEGGSPPDEYEVIQ